MGVSVFSLEPSNQGATGVNVAACGVIDGVNVGNLIGVGTGVDVVLLQAFQKPSEAARKPRTSKTAVVGTCSNGEYSTAN